MLGVNLDRFQTLDEQPPRKPIEDEWMNPGPVYRSQAEIAMRKRMGLDEEDEDE